MLPPTTADRVSIGIGRASSARIRSAVATASSMFRTRAEQDRELVAALTRRDVLGPDHLRQPAGDLDEDAVTGPWPNESLMTLKSSRSRKSRATLVRLRRRRASERST